MRSLAVRAVPSVVHVVVPAHDEAERIGRCLEALGAAADAAERVFPEVVVTTTLVLDRCSDDTEARAREQTGSRPRFTTLAVDAACVGVARRAGVLRAATWPADPGATWIACTDADSTVSPGWLVDHLELARDHDLVVGRVRPDPGELDHESAAEWQLRHTTGALHVHGANLGIRLSTYLALGGFRPVPEHEDALLFATALAAGVRWTRGSLVTTSARTVGRTPGGFAGYLSELREDVELVGGMLDRPSG